MASDFADVVQRFINSPPGQVAAGGVLAGIVWKFFERVEAVLTDLTKFEIAVWLVGVRLANKVYSWPYTFAKVFDRVFGDKHFSIKCLSRSVIASVATSALTLLLFALPRLPNDTLSQRLQELAFVFSPYILIANVIPDYIALLVTRFAVYLLQRWRSLASVVLVILADLCVTLYAASIGIYFGMSAYIYAWYHHLLPHGSLAASPAYLDAGGIGWHYLKAPYYIMAYGVPLEYGGQFTGGLWLLLPALFTSIWLWLYAGSGFILRAARRFDIGFDWFNRRFDIEKKPLSAIGLVAAAVVAILYWGVVIIFASVSHLP